MNIPLCKGQPWHRIFIVQRAAFQPRDITMRYWVVGTKTLIALLLLACASTAGATQINLNLGPRQTYTWGGWVFYNLRGYESTLPGKLTIDFGAPVRTRGAFVMHSLKVERVETQMIIANVLLTLILIVLALRRPR